VLPVYPPVLDSVTEWVPVPITPRCTKFALRLPASLRVYTPLVLLSLLLQLTDSPRISVNVEVSAPPLLFRLSMAVLVSFDVPPDVDNPLAPSTVLHEFCDDELVLSKV
jgi:hypothetical protein